MIEECTGKSYNERLKILGLTTLENRRFQYICSTVQHITNIYELLWNAHSCVATKRIVKCRMFFRQLVTIEVLDFCPMNRPCASS